MYIYIYPLYKKLGAFEQLNLFIKLPSRSLSSPYLEIAQKKIEIKYFLSILPSYFLMKPFRASRPPEIHAITARCY